MTCYTYEVRRQIKEDDREILSKDVELLSTTSELVIGDLYRLYPPTVQVPGFYRVTSFSCKRSIKKMYEIASFFEVGAYDHTLEITPKKY